MYITMITITPLLGSLSLSCPSFHQNLAVFLEWLTSGCIWALLRQVDATARRLDLPLRLRQCVVRNALAATRVLTPLWS